MSILPAKSSMLSNQDLFNEAAKIYTTNIVKRPVFDLSIIDDRAKTLAAVTVSLKTEFYGLDDIIDSVISSINAWYTFPALITRPVIINLWGLTGVGKTQLVRRLVDLLNFRDKFVEIQMDGIAGTSSHRSNTIASVLRESSIEQGMPGILLLDEFQRYRSIGSDGQDVKLERFQDVWMLLSDGKFASDSSMFQEIEMMIASTAYTKENYSKEDKKFKIYPYEARNIKRTLNINNTVNEIMQWNVDRLEKEVEKATKEKVGIQFDYTKTLIFISGNLDEAFDSSDKIDDCDTDADIFHDRTKMISVMDIKNSLRKRFKPEQISRFGNNHVIYPSISKQAYKQIIHSTCKNYINSISEITNIHFSLDQASEDVIYNNSVYPAQGTRPVFSSVHSIFSDGLVQIAFWAIKNNISKIKMSIDGIKFVLNGYDTKTDNSISVPISLDITKQQKKAPNDFLLTVAVHEAGHALLYALLKHKAPKEVKINTSSFKGGYMMPSVEEYGDFTKQSYLDNITVLFGGRVAELLVFGTDNITSGASQDIEMATRIASMYVRNYGFDILPGVEIAAAGGYSPSGIIPSVSTSDAIVNILNEEQNRAKTLLTDNKTMLVKIVEHLLANRVINKEEFINLLPELNFEDGNTSRENLWNSFK